MTVLLISRLLQGLEGWARKLVNHCSLVAVRTPTDRSKVGRNRCVIEHFDGTFVLSLCFFNLLLMKESLL